MPKFGNPKIKPVISRALFFSLGLFSLGLFSLGLPLVTGINSQAQSYSSPSSLSPELSAFLDKKNSVHSIGQRLFRANARACPLLLPEFRAKTHRLTDYPRRIRDAAANDLKAGKNFVIYEVDFPRTNGLRIGDILLDGQNKASSEIDKDVLNYRQGGFLRVKRDNEILLIAQNAPKICPYAVRIQLKGSIRAKAKGVEVILSQGIIDFTQNEHELALIIGHELAHLTEGHSNAGPLGGTKDESLEFEADRTGLDYAVRAGYDPYLAIEFWRRWAGSDDISSLRGKKRQRLERYIALKNYLETRQ